MADVAALSLAIDSTPVASAHDRLQALAAQGLATEATLLRLLTSAERTALSMERIAQSGNSVGASVSKIGAGAQAATSGLSALDRQLLATYGLQEQLGSSVVGTIKHYEDLIAKVTLTDRAYAAFSATRRAGVEAESREAQVVRALAESYSDLAQKTSDAARAAEIVSRSRAQLNPVGAAQDKLKDEVAEYTRLAKAGALTTQELGVATQAAQDRFTKFAAGLGVLNDNAAKSNYQLRYLHYQIGDIVSQLAGGGLDNPRLLGAIALQQGTDVADILTSGQGFASNMDQIVGKASNFLTVGRLAFGGVTAAVVAGTAALVSYRSAQAEVEQSLRGTGRASGATSQGINAAASAYGPAAGLSVSDARSYTAGFAATGRIGPEVYGQALSTVRDLAVTLGTDAPQAAAMLTKALADPARGMQALNEQTGFLDASTSRLIVNLTEQGRRTEAQQVLLRSMSQSLTTVAETTNGWAMAWDRVKRAASDAYDASGRAIAGVVAPTLDQQIAVLSQRLNNPGNTREIEDYRRNGVSEQDARRLAELNARRFRGGSRDVAPSDTTMSVGDRALSRLTTEDRLSDLQEQRRRQGAAGMESYRRAYASQESLAVQSIIDQNVPETREVEQLSNALERLNRARAYPELRQGVDERQLELAYQRQVGAAQTLLTAEEKRRASDELALASINARTDAERAAVAVRERELALAGQQLTADERQRQLDAARAQFLAQSTRAAQDRLRDAQESAATAGMLSYPRQQAEIELRFRRQFQENSGNAAAQRLDIQARDAQLGAARTEAYVGPLRSAGQSLDEQIASLRIQAETFGKSTEAVTRAGEAQRLYNEYARAGVTVNADLKARIEDYAAAAGKVAAAQEDLTRKQQESVGAMDDTRSAFRGATTGLFSDIVRGKNPLEGIKNALLSYSDKMFDRLFAGPLTEQLFGQMGKAGGGLFGDGLQSIFGSALGVPQAQAAVMQVTAQLVNVSGGLTAGLGGSGGLPGLSGLIPGATSAAGGGSFGTATGGSGVLSFGLGGPVGLGGAGVSTSGLTAFGLNGPAVGGVVSAVGGGLPVGSVVGTASAAFPKLTGGSFITPQQAYDGFRALGRSPEEASAMAAVISKEGAVGGKLFSGSFGYQGSERGGVLNPSGAFGFAQLNGPRQQDLLSYSNGIGGTPGDPATQLRFINQDVANYTRRIGLDPTSTRDLVNRYEVPAERFRSGEIAGADRIRGSFVDRAGGYGGSSGGMDGARPNWDASLDSFKSATGQAEQSLNSLGDAAGGLPDQVGSASGALNQFGAQLANFNPGSGGGGGGGFGGLGSLFGGGGSGDLWSSASEGIGAIWMANGGIVGPSGSIPLRRYAEGGIATRPQMAVFGEGSMPEAYVPLPDGRSIPVNMKNAPQTTHSSSRVYSPSFSIDARGSTMTEEQFRRIANDQIAPAIAQHDDEINRTFGQRYEGWRKSN